MPSLLIGVDHWIDRYYFNPQLIEKEWQRKKMIIIATVIANIMVFVLTIFAFIIGANGIFWMGLIMLGLYAVQYRVLKSPRFNLYHHFFLGAFILIAGLFMVLMGGILTSGGLVFIGLVCAFSSNMLNSQRGALLLMGLYLFTVLFTALSQFFLHPVIVLSTPVNFTFWVINIIWMSTFLVQFNNQYIREKEALEESEMQKVKELDEAKSNFYTAITHEFRTPLTIISGLLDGLNPQDHEEEETIHLIRKNSNQLLRLVNQLLDLSRINAGVVKPHLIRDDLIALIKYVMESFHMVAEVKKISMHWTGPADQYIVDIEPEMMESILSNLISNALKYTNPEGAIHLQLDIPEISGSTNHYRLTVSDNGVGMATDQLNRIFDRFYQVNGDIRHHEEGSGVGLALVKEYVQLLGGEIIVDSVIGRGTTFTLYLPITTQAKPSECIPDPTFSGGLPMASILTENGELADVDVPILLLVEDNPDMIFYLQKLLKNRYRIHTAMNGLEGLSKALMYIPDLIISDVMMPEMDGLTMIKNLKADLRTSHIPVIALTALVDIGSKLEALECGAEVYLTKPFNQEELNLRIEKMIALRHELHTRYSTQNFTVITNKEDEFILKVREVMAQFCEDEAFGINQLCREMAMSRTQLYRKFSALTNTTVHKFIRTYRLTKAMDLLRSSDLNVTQVAIETGFKNTSFFSRIFTEEFGINPSEVSAKTID
ncbi:MAG: response regulator [Saprospiraceae bacterium]|nr:response regulator [Saprospiraceae bacterium]